MPDCPSDTDLSGFLDESLPADRVAELSSHVDHCPQCQSRLDRLTDGPATPTARNQNLPSLIGSGSRAGWLSGPATELSPDAAPPEVHPEAGTLLFGTRPGLSAFTGLPVVPGFDVIAELGRGGMGVVYKARHRGLNRLVALKMILAGGAADPRIVQRFQFEAEVLARIQHPQVVQVYEADTFTGPTGVPIPYLAMELLEGGSLSRRLRDANGKPTTLPQREAAELIEGIARAVHAAHLQGVVHRDLKPGNILFGNADPKSGLSGSSLHTPQPTLLPKVTDFGLAKFTQDVGSEFTTTGQIVGTPAYMSPEQARGERVVGPATDVYGLGSILFQCLTGQPPFDGADPMSVLLRVAHEPAPDVRSLCPTVHRDLAAVVHRCLEKDVCRRYPAASELADDLQRFLENRPTVARPLRRRERVWLWAKRNPAVAGLLSALAAVLVVGFTMITVLWMRAENQAREAREARDQAEWHEKQAKDAARQTTAALQESQRQKAQLEFSHAVTLCEQGQVEAGLERFLLTLELAEANDLPRLAHVCRVNLAAWPARLPRDRRSFHHGPGTRIPVFLPNNQVAIFGVSNSASLWDIESGQRRFTYKTPPKFVRTLSPFFDYWSAAASPDGTLVAAGAGDGQVWVWEADKPDPIAAFEVAVTSEGGAWGVGFAPDGTLWASNGMNGVKRWNPRTGEMLAEMKPLPTDPKVRAPLNEKPVIQTLVVSRDGSRVYTGERNGLVREWDTATGATRRMWAVNGWINDIALSPDSRFLAVTGNESVCRVYDLTVRGLETPLLVQVVDLAGSHGVGVAFAPNGPELAIATGDGAVRVVHRTTGQPVGVPIRFPGHLTRLRFRPNERELAVSAGGDLHLCRPADLPGTLLNPDNIIRVRAVDIDRTGKRVAVLFADVTWVYDLHTGQPGPVLPPHTRGSVYYAIRFDPTRPYIVRSGRALLDEAALTDPKPIPYTEGFYGRMVRLEFLPNGSAFLVHNSDVVFRGIPGQTKVELGRSRLVTHPTGLEFRALSVRPDGKEFLVSFGTRLEFYNPDTFELTRPGWDAPEVPLDARYSPDGKRILLGLRNNSALLVDAATGQAVVPPMSHDGAVTSVAFSPDGSVLLTGSGDSTARFWDAATGRPLGPPLRHSGPIAALAYSPTGDRVATGTESGNALTWNPPPPPLTGTLDEVRQKVQARIGAANSPMQ